MQEDLHNELRFAAVRTIALDGIVWMISLFADGLHMAVPIGLLLGSAGMMINLLLLRKSILNAVRFGKTRDIAGYLLRCLTASAVMALGICFDSISTIAVVLPFLYPKLIFGVLMKHSLSDINHAVERK